MSVCVVCVCLNIYMLFNHILDNVSNENLKPKYRDRYTFFFNNSQHDQKQEYLLTYI